MKFIFNLFYAAIQNAVSDNFQTSLSFHNYDFSFRKLHMVLCQEKVQVKCGKFINI